MLPIVQLDSKGLYTFSNILSQVPPGAMTIANNVIIDRPGIVETRRGFDFYGTALPDYAIKGFIYDQALLWYCNDGELVYDSDGAGTWDIYSGLFYPPSGSFINSTQANGNFYFTTNNGVYKLASLTGNPLLSGGPPALDVTLTLGVSGTGNAIVNNSQVGYQIIWGYVDANNNLILGAPSEMVFLTNTSGSPQNVTIVTTIPAGVTTSYFVQVYRTPNTLSSSVPPGNNFQLAVEYQPNGTDITNKYVTITDAIPDTLLGAYIYTADGQPANLPNTPPPLALDICTFQGMTFYMNFTTYQQMDITMDSVGSPNGIQANDTITITDVNTSTSYTYTAKASNNFPSRQFAVYSSGTIAVNIDTTARNLVSAINQDPNNSLWYAYYQTGQNLLPGMIVLEARTLQQGAFFINSSRTTCWSPVIPTATQAYISGNVSSPNSFMVSKPAQPEAVPVAYTFPITTGQTNIIIYRGLALQDAVYMFTNGGVFRITGTDPTNIQVLLFDSSAILVGLQTPVILNNSIYYYSTQGVCNVSSGGNQIVSRNIERDIQQLSVLSNFSAIAFGCAYESDRKYLLYTPAEGSDVIPQQNYVYNWITLAWTLWNRPTSAAIVSPNDQRLYLADGLGNVFQERKSISNNDYSDELYTVTITGTDTTLNTITLSSSASVDIGDVIQQTVGSDQFNTQVLGNDLITGVLTVTDATGFVNGSASDYRSIVTQVKYTPITCGFAEYLKKYLNWQFMFSNANFSECTATFTSDLYQTAEVQLLVPKSSGGWGTLPWGTFPWGVSTIPEQVIPTWPTPNTAMAHWVIIELSLTQAFTSLSLDGIAATFDIVSTRTR